MRNTQVCHFQDIADKPNLLGAIQVKVMDVYGLSSYWLEVITKVLYEVNPQLIYEKDTGRISFSPYFGGKFFSALSKEINKRNAL